MRTREFDPEKVTHLALRNIDKRNKKMLERMVRTKRFASLSRAVDTILTEMRMEERNNKKRK